MAHSPGLSLQALYSHPAVAARIVEFLGGPPLAASSAVFLRTWAPPGEQRFDPRPVVELAAALAAGGEIARSLWDRRSLIAHLDLEYVNFDHPYLAFLDPERCFALQRPVALATLRLLGEAGVAPLRLLTGRGHHLSWRIERASGAWARLVRLGRVHAELAETYARPHRPTGEVVDEELGRAYSGLGLVLEHLGHQVLREAATHCTLPVQLTAVEVGLGERGREAISFDLSEYGDPLHRRSIRVPFGAYLKAQPLLNDSVGPLVAVPYAAGRERRALAMRGDLAAAAAFAGEASTAIPDGSAGTEALLDDYERSELAAFHRRFYSLEPEPPEMWADSYDRVDLDALPLCIRWALVEPNDLLLKPAAIQNLVRSLLSLGWHPRHIAGLIHSKYARDFGWIPELHYHDARMRAEFYTRLFAGLCATGLDGLLDFNCRSTQEKGYCPAGSCAANLADFRDSLIARRSYGRLACWPVHRLFLPHEHL